jgi:hypothetical protein
MQSPMVSTEQHQPSFYFGSASKLQELTRIELAKIREIRVKKHFLVGRVTPCAPSW